MASLLADVRYAVRGLLARPLFLLVAVSSLGLGIGVNTALFSLYHQVVLRPLPVPEAGRLVNLSAPGPKHGNTSNNSAGPREDVFSYPMFRDLQRLQTPFTGIAAHRSLGVNVAIDGETRSGNAMLVSGSYFPVLGLAPQHGRLIGPQDDAAIGGSSVAVLSDAYWREQLGTAPDVVDRTISVNGRAHVVVGVAPPGFRGTTFGVQPDVFIPITQRWELSPRAERSDQNRQDYWVYLFARLAPGMSLAQAQADINGPYGQLIRELELPLHAFLDAARREEFAAKQVVLTDGARGQSSASRNAGLPLAMLMAAAGLVLAVACLNIANLLLARGAARAAEFAVRASLGASRARLAGQLIVEALVLGSLGAVTALPLAAATLVLVGNMMPASAADSFELVLAAPAIRFALALGAATVIGFGLFPALQLARAEPVGALRGDSARSGGSRVAARFRTGLAVGQIALSMVALVLSGLFLQSLANLGRVDLGLDVERVATFSIAPELSGYPAERSAALFDRIETELAGLPGVTAVAGSMVPILSGNEWGSNISLRGFEDVPAEDMHVFYNKVGADFFRLFDVPLLAGRAFTDADDANAPKVAIVNRSFVERFALGTDAVGKRLAFGSRDDLDIEIVGVVEDTKYAGVRERGHVQVFVPRRQDPGLGELNFFVASELTPAQMLSTLRAAVATFDPNLPVSNLRTMDEHVAQLTTNERFVGLLSGGFALLSTLLAALGLYGVLSFTLAQRMREIGLRLALGAAPARLSKMVLAQVGRMTLTGALVGLVCALALGRLAESLLFGLRGHDPVVLTAAAAILATVAFGTGWLPARRASRIDPVEALRHE
jgi:putative ABC transport system permease protein